MSPLEIFAGFRCEMNTDLSDVRYGGQRIGDVAAYERQRLKFRIMSEVLTSWSGYIFKGRFNCERERAGLRRGFFIRSTITSTDVYEQTISRVPFQKLFKISVPPNCLRRRTPLLRARNSVAMSVTVVLCFPLAISCHHWLDLRRFRFG